LEQATAVAQHIGARHVLIESHEVEDPRYLANQADRCYFCKDEVYGLLAAYAREHGFRTVADGTNLDDLKDPRPGRRAAKQQGILSPLVDAGFTKAAVRDWSRQLGLRTWDKPAAACLSSRIAYGIRITPNLLARVERAEQAVRSLLTSYGVENVRVRDLGETASIEIDKHLLDRVDHSELVDAVVAQGFPAARLDPRGFRSGSMNERLKEPEKYR
jgi:uncharacterized protein